MTCTGKFDLKGLENYLEVLAAAGKDVDEATARALIAGAEVAQDGMRSRAPVDTGNLISHIQIDGPFQVGNHIFCFVGVIRKAQFTDKETAIYANVQEYGSAHLPAHPYIRPTLQHDRGKVQAAMRRSLEEDGTL